MQYTFESAKASRLLSRVILSSDDPEIIAVAEELGLEVPFMRPADLAGDATTSLEVIIHALNELKSQGKEYDAVCLLQPTTPFRPGGLIDEAIAKFTKGGFDSLISVREVPAEYNAHWIFEEKDGTLQLATGEKEIIPRRQDLSKAYHRDGGIYITKISVLMEQNSLYGDKIGFVDTTGSVYVNIDTEEDWEVAARLISSL